MGEVNVQEDVVSEAEQGDNPLFQPLELGPKPFHLSHRIVLAPLTRCRSYGGIPQPHAVVYYSQRTTPGCLLIAEATGVCPTSDGSAERLGMRLSPYADYGEAHYSDPVALGTYMAEQLSKRGIAYAHFVEPRMRAAGEVDNSPFTQWPFRNALAAGGYNREEGMKSIQSGKADAIVYGRLFLSNHDLPKRFKLKAPLDKFYTRRSTRRMRLWDTLTTLFGGGPLYSLQLLMLNIKRKRKRKIWGRGCALVSNQSLQTPDPCADASFREVA